MADFVVPNLCVRENLFLNPRAAGSRAPAFVRPAREHHAALQLGQEIGLRPNDPALPIEWLSGGNQQKVVLGRWLIFKARSASSRTRLWRGRRIQGGDLPSVRCRTAARRGDPAGFDRLEEVGKVCHRALVFDRGRVVAELGIGDMSAENLLAAASASIGQVEEALMRIEPDIESHRAGHAIA